MGVWLTTPRRETVVEIAIDEQIAELGRMTVTQLRQCRWRVPVRPDRIRPYGRISKRLDAVRRRFRWNCCTRGGFRNVSVGRGSDSGATDAVSPHWCWQLHASHAPITARLSSGTRLAMPASAPCRCSPTRRPQRALPGNPGAGQACRIPAAKDPTDGHCYATRAAVLRSVVTGRGRDAMPVKKSAQSAKRGFRRQRHGN
jgi:hypothetical protein